MAYFAKLDDSNIVTQVIAVADEDTQDENNNEDIEKKSFDDQ